MTFSVMITTRNRLADLQRTCHVLRALNPAPLEILITADGCMDNTVSMLKAEMAKAEIRNLKLIVNEVGKGSVASRDRMMREARGDLVLALDDDSYPEQSNCLALCALLFAERPSLAVAHFPQRTDEYPETLTHTDFGLEHLTRSFANSGAVLRRSVYLQLPGFVPEFFHMYEEPDYALQCVAAGYEVLFTPIVTIRHHYSGAARSELRNHQRHSRNECWSTVMRCPLPQMPAVVAYRIFSQFRYACQRGLGWVIREPLWWWQALRGIPGCLKKRQPVSWKAYKQWLQLK
jgi:GT2 family glycosyltransferase